MSNILKITGAGLSAAAEDTDANFNQTVLLLHGDGTNGAQNNTFVDSSTNNFTITRNGNTTQGTFSPFSAPDGRWSNYFDGTGDYLSFTDTNNDLDLGGTDVSIDMWVYLSNISSTKVLLSKHGGVASWNSTNGFEYQIQCASGKFIFYYNTSVGASGAVASVGDSVARNPNQWYHLCIATDASNNIAVFVDGTRIATASHPITKPTTRTFVRIGLDLTTTNYFVGYLSNLNVVTGASAYDPTDTTITVPTAPPTNVSGTSLLTCQSNRFVDNSSNAFAITPSGDVKVTPFSPFAPTAAYDASVNGGSGYFDGTGDYLSIADNAALEIGASQFCIEGWIYLNALPASGARMTLLSKWGTGALSYIFQTYNNSGTMQLEFGYSTTGSSAVVINGNASVTAGAWHHIAVTRDASNDIRLFFNGTVVAGPTSASATFHNNTQAVDVGRNGGNSNYLNGYISSCRLVIGSAVYTSAFTPSTSPLTAITDTELLCNFTNAGIFDNTGKNNLETVGNAQIDTTTKKYGTGSMEFDGTGDWLQIPYSQEFDFGTGDFTIEFFLYLNNISSRMDILEKRTTAGTSNGLQITANRSVNGRLELFSSPAGWPSIAVNSVLSATTWHHVAITRNGSTFTMWVDGVSVGTDTDSSATADQVAPLYIGNSKDNQPTNGFIDEFRITKGVARYTTTFTPPTAPFLDQ